MRKVLIAALAATTVLCVGCKSEDRIEDLETKPHMLEYTDADEYYQERGEVLDVIEAPKSKETYSEQDIVSVMQERGFPNMLAADYTINGDYDSVEFDADTKEKAKHPTYSTYYASSSGVTWIIMVCNGQIMANPLSYQIDNQVSGYLLFSETPEITSYDSATNRFFVTIPKPEEVKVHVVDRIDAETLDSLDAEKIGSLE